MKKNILFFMVFSFVGLAFCAQKEEVKSPGELPTLAKGFVTMLEKGEFTKAAEMFNSQMKQALPVEKLEQTWKGLLTQTGAFQAQEGTRTEKIQQYDAVYVACRFENIALDTKVVFDKDKRIAGLFFVPAQAGSGK